MLLLGKGRAGAWLVLCFCTYSAYNIYTCLEFLEPLECLVPYLVLSAATAFSPLPLPKRTAVAPVAEEVLLVAQRPDVGRQDPAAAGGSRRGDGAGGVGLGVLGCWVLGLGLGS